MFSSFFPLHTSFAPSPLTLQLSGRGRGRGSASCRFALCCPGKVSTWLILSPLLRLSLLTVLMFISSRVAAVSFPYPPMSLTRRAQALQCGALMNSAVAALLPTSLPKLEVSN